jgi:hypothetical protein
MYSKQVLLKFANNKDRRNMKRVLIKVKGGKLEDGAAAHPYPQTTESCLMNLTKIQLQSATTTEISEDVKNSPRRNVKLLHSLQVNNQSAANMTCSRNTLADSSVSSFMDIPVAIMPGQNTLDSQGKLPSVGDGGQDVPE